MINIEEPIPNYPTGDVVIDFPNLLSQEGINISEPFSGWSQYFALKINNPKLWRRWVKLYGNPPGSPKRDTKGKIVNREGR